MYNVNVDAIAQFCPNHEWLDLARIYYKTQQYSSPKEVHGFHHLKFLVLVSIKFLSAELRTTFLRTVSSSKKECVHFVHFHDMTAEEEDLTSVLRTYKFEHLKYLSFKHCPNLSLDHVLFLLSLDNPLRYLNVIARKNINRPEANTIELRMKELNLHLVKFVFPLYGGEGGHVSDEWHDSDEWHEHDECGAVGEGLYYDNDK